MNVYYHVSYIVYNKQDLQTVVGRGGELLETDMSPRNMKSAIHLIEHSKQLIASRNDKFKGKYIHIESISKL